MKKLLLLLVTVGCMMMANAQIKIVYNGTEYNVGETIPMTVTEEEVTENEGVFVGNVNLVNTNRATMMGITVGATIDAPGYVVTSVCGLGGCQEGTISQPFDLEPNTPTMLMVDYAVDPSAMNADKKGLSTVSVNVGSDSYVFYFELTYVPTNAGIEGIEQNNVKVWPNPTVNAITVGCENASDVLIMDVAGRVMQHVEVNGANEIKVDMSNYSNGVYMCGIVIDGVLKGMSRVVKY